MNNKILKFDAKFNEPLDNLSEGVEEIHFAYLSIFNHNQTNLLKIIIRFFDQND